MSQAFWQAKIWGLLHDPLLKSLYHHKNHEGGWQQLIQPNSISAWIKQADYIAAASDRPSWDRENKRGAVSYTAQAGLHVSHLLSGKPQDLKFPQYSTATTEQDRTLQALESEIIETKLMPLLEGLTDIERDQKAFWWLWRCLPVEVAKRVGESSALLPADTRIPDCSIWSHNSLTAALAGSLAGIEQQNQSRPHLVIFSFTPVQEMIKASRKMQDFWAGSWILHYLSAKVCWKWACEYGPDSLIYPSLYAQPLIDVWLRREWDGDFRPWIKAPSSRQLLTAGFPNVLVAVLPEESVQNAKGNALTFARETLRTAWLELGDKVFEKLPKTSQVNRDRLWEGWLKYQWQSYGTALPLGDSSNILRKTQGTPCTREDLTPLSSLKEEKEKFLHWVNAQNRFCQVSQLPNDALNPNNLVWKQECFTSKTCPTLAELWTYDSFNVGLWWSKNFDQLRRGLASVKNARAWQLPSAFSPRSTISGIGPVLHPKQHDQQGKPTDWVSESETRQFWQKERGWFDGREELNATEVLKRGLQKVLPDLLGLDQTRLASAYPDLTVGVAGWLHWLEQQGKQDTIQQYCQVGQTICDRFHWAKEASQQRWGIPWIDENNVHRQYPHPRLLNDGWLIEEYPSEQESDQQKQEQRELRSTIQSFFSPGQNPADWYVLAAGDGDDMGGWLKGGKLKPYKDYVAKGYPENKDRWQGVDEFLDSPKRMGPATHAALSRALLDFSNQLAPHLTEQRYAGRLIYGGGDDVLAYTNLWEWDSWLWDIRQCFRGADDPHGKFDSAGDYWQWQGDDQQAPVDLRPLFTMGHTATISFGIVIANQSVPLALALENLWSAEEEAKKHRYHSGCSLKNKQACYNEKNSVQVRILFGNGNCLKATGKFEGFEQWRSLLNIQEKYPEIDLDPALFEQAAEVWRSHPVPFLDDSDDPLEAIQCWTTAFIERRDLFKGDDKAKAKAAFQQDLIDYLKTLCLTTLEADRDREVSNWLKLAAFVLRKRNIEISKGGQY